MMRATVRSTVELRRRNLQVVFKQRLLVPVPVPVPPPSTTTTTAGRVEVKGGKDWGADINDDDDDDGVNMMMVTAAAAEVTCTCLSRDTGRPVPCPPGLLETFASLVASRGQR